jgi:hypothetical protein
LAENQRRLNWRLSLAVAVRESLELLVDVEELSAEDGSVGLMAGEESEGSWVGRRVYCWGPKERRLSRKS